MTPEFPDGVRLVELGPVGDPAAVPDVVATALGVTPQAGMSVTVSVAHALSERRMLVVLVAIGPQDVRDRLGDRFTDRDKTAVAILGTVAQVAGGDVGGPSSFKAACAASAVFAAVAAAAAAALAAAAAAATANSTAAIRAAARSSSFGAAAGKLNGLTMALSTHTRPAADRRPSKLAAT